MKALLQLRSGKIPQILIGIHLQPEQQRFLGEDVLLHVQTLIGLDKILVIGAEGAALLLRPGLSHTLPQGRQELGVIAGAAELNVIQLRSLVEVQKFIIGPDPGLISQGRHDPPHIARNPGRTKMAQHTDPLVALLNVEIAQIFEAGNGIPDALVSQMVPAQRNPFLGKLALNPQQGQEAWRKGADAAGGNGTHDPLCGNLHHADLLNRVGRVLRQELIEHLGLGGLSGQQVFSVFLLTMAHGQTVFFFCDLKFHGSLHVHKFNIL